jgi:glycerophosphoryl diester phosphodiesterase
MTSPVLVCHRGASALAPENSLEAFRIAMAGGVDFS